MKKFVWILLAVVMAVSLVACGQDNNQTSQSAQTQESTQQSQESSQQSSADTQVSSQADLKTLAEGCIDKPLADLIALIGEPESSEYADSCLNPGVGVDGILFYDGFVVYTYREGEEEVVTYVE